MRKTFSVSCNLSVFCFWGRSGGKKTSKDATTWLAWLAELAKLARGSQHLSEYNLMLPRATVVVHFQHHLSVKKALG